MKNRFVRLFVVALLTQLTAWTILTLTDLLDEKQGIDLLFFCCIAVPVLIVVCYYLFREKLYGDITSRWKWMVYLSALWFVFTSAVGYGLSVLVLYHNAWIVEQDVVGWNNYLNGVEYPIFALFLCVVPLIGVLPGELIVWIVKKITGRSGRA